MVTNSTCPHLFGDRVLGRRAARRMERAVKALVKSQRAPGVQKLSICKADENFRVAKATLQDKTLRKQHRPRSTAQIGKPRALSAENERIILDALL